MTFSPTTVRSTNSQHFAWCDTTECSEGEDTVAGTTYWIHSSAGNVLSLPSGIGIGNLHHLEIRVQQQDANTEHPRNDPGEDGKPYVTLNGLPLMHPDHARTLAGMLIAAADAADERRTTLRYTPTLAAA